MMMHLKEVIQIRGRRIYITIWHFAVLFGLLLIFTSSPAFAATPIDDGTKATQIHAQGDQTSAPPVLLFCLGDSLSHGTMDAANNETNTLNAYVQLIADALAYQIPLYFEQPFFDDHQNRIKPFVVPTNLGVDGGDIFSLIGLEYYMRAGEEKSVFSNDLLADILWPTRLKDKYDKVLYPINLLARKSVSQLSAANWLIRAGAPLVGIEKAIGILWSGNNDSGLAALGGGGSNPMFQPMPFDVIKSELKPALKLLLGFGEAAGVLSFEPYTQASIERNLTDADDFVKMYEFVVKVLEFAPTRSAVDMDLFLLTLPYYSAVGYLMDSEDIEFYLQKLDPDYTVPLSFARVAEPGEPITDPLKGDRISLLTFGLMYAFLSSGHSVAEVNQVLEKGGMQRDGLVLSEAEQQLIMARIDTFNDAIKFVAAVSGPNVHVIDVGQYLKDALTGKLEIEIDGRVLTRKWTRGCGFSLDGVHPGYTGQALVANYLLASMNSILGLEAEFYNLSDIMRTDPYVDHDEDGWAPGPQYEASGIPELLFLFTDPDDTDPNVGMELPPDIWDLVSDILLREILQIPQIQEKAIRQGIVAE
jgi:lysophospholipase L1-like esterase